MLLCEVRWLALNTLNNMGSGAGSFTEVLVHHYEPPGQGERPFCRRDADTLRAGLLEFDGLLRSRSLIWRWRRATLFSCRSSMQPVASSHDGTRVQSWIRDSAKLSYNNNNNISNNNTSNNINKIFIMLLCRGMYFVARAPGLCL